MKKILVAALLCAGCSVPVVPPPPTTVTPTTTIAPTTIPPSSDAEFRAAVASVGITKNEQAVELAQSLCEAMHFGTSFDGAVAYIADIFPEDQATVFVTAGVRRYCPEQLS